MADVATALAARAEPASAERKTRQDRLGTAIERAVARWGKAEVLAWPDQDLTALEWCWENIARPEQLAPAEFTVLLLQWGRGAGKTRTAAEMVRSEVEAGRAQRVALVGRTAADVRDVMVEGASGILAISPPWFMPKYEPSKRRLTFPNGAVATTYSADEPNLLRGPEHDFHWSDELAAWAHVNESWDNLQMGLRAGPHPRGVVTTTPRPIKLLRDIIAAPGTVVSRSSTYANAANLPASFLERMRRQYEGTRIGRQELHGELIDAVEGALWTLEAINRDRASAQQLPAFEEIVVAVDPATTAEGIGAEAGIVVAGRAGDHFFVLADDSIAASPDSWGRVVINDVHAFAASGAVVEGNAGHGLLTSLIRNIEKSDALTAASIGAAARLPIRVRLVNASQSKQARAEPISALYEQRRVHHVGIFPDLEHQMTTWLPGMKSPDRLDAMVHGVHALARSSSHLAAVGHHTAAEPARPAPEALEAPSALTADDAMRSEAEAVRRQLRRFMGDS